MRSLPLFGLAGSMMILALAVPPGAAQAPPQPSSPGAAPRPTRTPPPPGAAPPYPPPASQARTPRGATGASQIPANGQRITLEVNKGTLVRLAGPAATVFVANPDI